MGLNFNFYGKKKGLLHLAWEDKFSGCFFLFGWLGFGGFVLLLFLRKEQLW